MLFYVIMLYLIFVTITAIKKCSNESPHIPKYYLIERCHRSKLRIVARANYTSLIQCQRLGIEKKALAINFSPREATNCFKDRPQYTCEALACGEVVGGVTLSNDTRFDYYSIYANPLPNINSSCLPATGMFQLLERKLNYVQATAACSNMSGVLADVRTEQRTEAMAQVIAAAKVDAAYVGMRRHNTTTFRNTNGDSLDCSTYRAWEPGHPRKQYRRFDCAVITRNKAWRSTPCKETYSALCELIPSGPYTIGSIFPKKKDDRDVNVTIVKTNL